MFGLILAFSRRPLLARARPALLGLPGDARRQRATGSAPRPEHLPSLCPIHGRQQVNRDDLPNFGQPDDWDELVETEFAADCWRCRDGTPLPAWRARENDQYGHPVHYVRCPTHGLLLVHRRRLRPR